MFEMSYNCANITILHKTVKNKEEKSANKSLE